MTHQYSRNADHIRNRGVPAPSNKAINDHLNDLLSPLVYNQHAYYRSLGMRSRIPFSAVDGRSSVDIALGQGAVGD